MARGPDRALVADFFPQIWLLFQEKPKSIPQLVYGRRSQQRWLVLPPPMILNGIGMVRFGSVCVNPNNDAARLITEPLGNRLQSQWFYLVPVCTRRGVKATNGERF